MRAVRTKTFKFFYNSLDFSGVLSYNVIKSKQKECAVGETEQKKKLSQIKGKILSGVGGMYSAVTEDGRVLLCSARGVLRFSGISPFPGDNVLISEMSDGRSAIDEILPRKNFFTRPPCANIDKLFITIACADPDPSYITSDKLTVAAEYYSTTPIIIITKSDIAPEKAEELRAVYESCGYPVFVTSSQNGEGVEPLRKFVMSETDGCTSVFAGESGVGKSSLLNSIFPELMLKTGNVSRKISRGKHTTRAVTLYPLEGEPSFAGAFIADTPGFGMFDLDAITDLMKEDIAALFPEFDPYIGECRYRKCTHLREEGCAVIEALSEKKIALVRHESYLKIYEEMKTLHPYKKKQ